MTYITKYRPKKFSEVVGQDAAVRALQRAIDKGNSQTFLITGPTGVGKTTLARIAANAAGCTGDDMNIIEIDAATHTGIDDMRHVAEIMRYAPLAGKAKAIIIDEAHALSKQAVTSLLKTFEEPPSWGLWFMCTTEPNKVPAAIRSRCLHINLKPVSRDTIQDLLLKIIGSEKLKVNSKVLDLCVTEAQGSPRQALVNLAACEAAKSVEEAAELLSSAFENPQAIDLARFLSKGGSWEDCQKILKGMKDLNAESVRQVIRAYMTTMVLNIPSRRAIEKPLAVLEAFEQPCNSQDGISPIILRCARLLT